MKTKILSAFGAIVLAIVLVACSGPSAGYIKEKKYSEEYYYTTMQCYSYNDKGVCTFQMPVQHYVPPTWKFDLYYEDEHGWVGVTENTYNSYKIGDFYNSKEH